MALTERKRRYADARLSGMSQRDAAIHAGCPAKSASQAASRYEKDADVIAAMKRKQAVQANVNSDVKSVNFVKPDTHIPEPANDPLEFFAQLMNDAEAEPKLRLDAAKALASFTVPKPGETGKKASRQASAERSASSGKFAAPAAPKLVIDNR